MTRAGKPSKSSPGPGRIWSFVGSPAFMGGATLLLLVPFLLQHAHGRFDVETDFFGEYGPYARDFMAGRIPENFPYRGPGYPLALALVGFVVPDLFLAGKLLSLAGALLVVMLTTVLARRMAGPRAGFLAGAFCLVQPVLLAQGWSVGNDMLFAAMALGSLTLLHAELRAPGGASPDVTPRVPWRLVVSGTLAGIALLTRPNGAFLPVVLAGALLVLDDARRWPPRLGRAALLLAGFAAPLALWLVLYHGAHGHLPLGAGYRNVLGILHPNEINVSADVYRRLVETDVESFGALISRHGPALAWAAVKNIPDYLVLNARSVHGLPIALLALFGGVVVLRRRDVARRDLLLFISGIAAFALLLLTIYESRFHLFLVAPVALAAALFFVSPRSGGFRAWPGDLAGVQPIGVPFLIAVALTMPLLPGIQAARNLIGMEELSAGEFTAGRFLATQRTPLGAVAARKPHVAWAAGRAYRGVPVGELSDLPDSLRARGVAFLNYGPTEMEFLPQYMGLLSPAGIPRGLQLLWLMPGPPCRALYRVLPPGDASLTVPASLMAPFEELGLVFERSGFKARVTLRLATDEFMKGRLFLEQGRSREALDALRIANRIVPNAGEAIHLLGVAALECGEWHEALDALNRAAPLGYADTARVRMAERGMASAAADSAAAPSP